MQDVREQRIYCAEQIFVPDDLPVVMKNFTKAAIREQPKDLVGFAASYFEEELRKKMSGEDPEPSPAQKPAENAVKREGAKGGEAPGGNKK